MRKLTAFLSNSLSRPPPPFLCLSLREMQVRHRFELGKTAKTSVLDFSRLYSTRKRVIFASISLFWRGKCRERDFYGDQWRGDSQAPANQRPGKQKESPKRFRASLLELEFSKSASKKATPPFLSKNGGPRTHLVRRSLATSPRRRKKVHNLARGWMCVFLPKVCVALSIRRNLR